MRRGFLRSTRRTCITELGVRRCYTYTDRYTEQYLRNGRYGSHMKHTRRRPLRPPCLRPVRVTVVCLARRSPLSTAPTLWERLRAVFAQGALPLVANPPGGDLGQLLGGDETVRGGRKARTSAPSAPSRPLLCSLCAPLCSQAPLCAPRSSPTALARRPMSPVLPSPPPPPPPTSPPALAAARGRSRQAVGNL